VRAPPAVVVMAYRVIVIVLHDQRHVLPYVLDEFPRLRALVNQIAQHPKLVVNFG
jgi:hypothetical protein